MNQSGKWIGLALVCYHFFSHYPDLITRDLSWDEPFSAFYSQFALSRLIQELFKGNNPPLYEVFLHGYTWIFGISERALRMPSLLFGCATVWFLFRSGYRLQGWWSGVFAALLFSFNNLQYFYGLSARMYALFSMLTAAALYLSIMCYQEPHVKKHFYWLMVVNILLCYTHYFAGLVLVAQVMSWLFAFRQKEFFKRMFMVFLGCLIGVLPLGWVFWQRASGFMQGASFQPPSSGILPNVMMNLLNGPEVYKEATALLGIGIIIATVLGIYRRKFITSQLYLIILFLLTAALPILLTWYFEHTVPLFVDRYYLYATLPIFLLFAYLIPLCYRPVASILVPVFLIYMLHLTYKGFTRLNNDYMLREWQGATLTAQTWQKEKPSSIILISPLWADLGFSYYYNRDLFHQPESYNERLEQQGVYRIWGPDSLNQILMRHQGCPVIYYADEKNQVDSLTDGNFRLLQRKGYTQEKTAFFPLCTRVIVLTQNDSIIR